MTVVAERITKIVGSYYSLGFTPIPLQFGGKHPLTIKVNGRVWTWGEWKTRRPTLDEVEKVFTEVLSTFGQVNIGLICGRTHGNLVVLDVDDTERFREFVDTYKLPLPPTTIVRTRKGFHYYFLYPEGLEITRVNHIGDFGVELRGDGHYVVAPPSVVDGHVYEFVNPPVGNNEPIPSNLTLLDIPKELLHLLINPSSSSVRPLPERKLPDEVLSTVRSLLVPHWTEGVRHDLSLFLAGWFAKLGVPYEETERLIVEVAEAAGDTEIKDRLRAIYDTYTKNTNGNEVKGWSGLIERLPESVLTTLKTLLSPNGNGNPTCDRPSNPLTDLGNAERLVSHFGDFLKFVPQWGWLVWDGRRWVVDKGEVRVTEFAEETVRKIYEEASKATDPNERVKLAKWAIASENRQRINAMIELAAPMVRDDAENFDRDPYLLNCLNGVVDLRTGELRPHDPNLRITKLCFANYNPDADAPTWRKFLNDIFCGDEQLIAYIQRALGYSLTGDVSENVLFICWGSGSNGKSTLLGVISEILGDYAKTVSPDALLRRNQQSDSHPTAIADLFGVRFAVAHETDEGKHLATARVKMLTGGDKVKARFMRKDYFEFLPTHKLWLATNYKPVITDTTYAMWRRLHLIPFRAFFDETRRDKRMKEKLLAEKEGILAWLIEGCLRWQQEGLNPPKVVREATEEYRSEMDKIQAWLEACCIYDPNAVTPFAELYESYVNWCRDAEEEPLGKRAFGNRLTEKGFDKVKVGEVACRRGLRLRDDVGGTPPKPTDGGEPPKLIPPEDSSYNDLNPDVNDSGEPSTPVGCEFTTPNFPQGRQDATWLPDIQKWMSAKFTCPECRRPLVQDDHSPEEWDIWRCLNPSHDVSVRNGVYWVGKIPEKCCVMDCDGDIALNEDGDEGKCSRCNTKYVLPYPF